MKACRFMPRNQWRNRAIKRNHTNCRHAHAYPTVLSRVAGFLWCPDCGAHRLIRLSVHTDEYERAGEWIYPTGQEDVVKQVERSSRMWD